jgi:tetratricopeptide (TPR) repeat protein
METQRQAYGVNSKEAFESLLRLAQCCLESGAYSEASTLFEEALRRCSGDRAVSPEYLITVEFNLARAYAATGSYPAAEKMVIQAIERIQTHNDGRLGLALDLLTSLYDRDGRFELSEPIHAYRIGLIESSLGPVHPSLVVSLENHAAALQGLGRDNQAEALRIRSQVIRSRTSTELKANA